MNNSILLLGYFFFRIQRHSLLKKGPKKNLNLKKKKKSLVMQSFTCDILKEQVKKF